MARGTNIKRVNTLKAALKKAKASDLLSNTELVALYGISKGAFTNIKNQIASFPEGQEGPRNSILYPAKAALEALLKHETREDEEEEARRRRAAEILGENSPRGRRKKAEEIWLPPSEMLKLSRLRAEIEQREREQGEYVPVHKVPATASRIYATIAEILDQLDIKVDPNGLLGAGERGKIAELGRSALLVVHGELSDMLGVDVDDLASGTQKPSRKAARTKRAPARRKR